VFTSATSAVKKKVTTESTEFVLSVASAFTSAYSVVKKKLTTESTEFVLSVHSAVEKKSR